MASGVVLVCVLQILFAVDLLDPLIDAPGNYRFLFEPGKYYCGWLIECQDRGHVQQAAIICRLAKHLVLTASRGLLILSAMMARRHGKVSCLPGESVRGLRGPWGGFT